jgi:hypothetical protein
VGLPRLTAASSFLLPTGVLAGASRAAARVVGGKAVGRGGGQEWVKWADNSGEGQRLSLRIHPSSNSRANCANEMICVPW